MTQYPTFVELSRKPALKSKETTIDPTLRDTMENGMETTRAKFTRRRREWDVTIEFLSGDDKAALDRFTQFVAVYGAAIFLFPDNRNQQSPQTYTVRFSKLPSYNDAGWVQDAYRQTVNFSIREV